jgi:rubrerythrin
MKDPESIYRRFVQFEEAAASVYLRFASLFANDEQLSSFWLEMAMHEKQHAGLLEFCIHQHLFTSDLPDDSEIQKQTVFLQNLEMRVAGARLTPKDAFAIAIEMESSEINAIYSRLTTSLHGSAYLLRRKISTALPHHLDDLLTAARKFGLTEDALQELHRVRERCSETWHPPH